MTKAQDQPFIVVGADGSDASILAVRWSLEQARLMGTRLLVVTAFNIPWTIMISPTHTDDDYARDAQAVREALDDYAAFAAEGHVLVGASLSLSKAYTIYGARAGALVFPWCTDAALGAALSVSCRGTYSNCARAPMSVLLRMTSDAEALGVLAAEHAR